MSLARPLAWNTGIQLAGKGVSTAFGVVIVGLLTRYLGQEGFGAYSTANAFLQIFTLFLDLGINVTFVALLGEHAGDKAYEQRCVSATFTFRAISALAICIIAPLIGWISPYPSEIKWAIIALTGSLLFPSLTQIVTGVQQRHLRMYIAAIGEVIGRIILLIGILVARSYGWGLLPIMWLVSLGGFANFVFNYLLTRSITDFSWRWDPVFWKEMLSRSWPIGVSILFNLVYYKADTLILALSRSQAEVGIYSAAYRVLEILITIPFMYAGLILPILSRSWKERAIEQCSKLMRDSTHVMILLIAPMITGTFILGTRVMTMIAGEEFLASGAILHVLIIATGIIYLNVVFAHGIVALQLQRKMLPVYITTAIVTLIGYLLLIPLYGMWAAGWLTVASEAMVTAGSLYFTQKTIRFSIPWKDTAIAWISSGIMAAAIFTVRDAWLGTAILVGIITYTGSILLLGGVSKETLKEIFTRRV